MNTKNSNVQVVSLWGNYVQSKNGTAADIRKSVQEIRSRVAKDREIFTKAAMIDGGIALRKK